jgi:hypothetical protein
MISSEKDRASDSQRVKPDGMHAPLLDPIDDADDVRNSRRRHLKLERHRQNEIQEHLQLQVRNYRFLSTLQQQHLVRTLQSQRDHESIAMLKSLSFADMVARETNILVAAVVFGCVARVGLAAYALSLQPGGSDTTKPPSLPESDSVGLFANALLLAAYSLAVASIWICRRHTLPMRSACVLYWVVDWVCQGVRLFAQAASITPDSATSASSSSIHLCDAIACSVSGVLVLCAGNWRSLCS